MPVDIRRVDDITATIAGIYREAETALIRTITQRLAYGLDRSDWQTSRLAALGALRRSAQAIVTALNWTASHELRAAIAAAYRAGNADAVSELHALISPHGDHAPRALTAAAQRGAQAIQALASAIVHELGPLHEAILPQAVDAYREAIARAAARKLAGAQTWREAAQDAWSQLVSQGITHYRDASGRNWQLSTYVAMAVGTAAHRAAIAGQVDQLVARGVRLVSVDDQPRECALCRPWEHQVLALWGATGRHLVDHAHNPGQVEVNVLATLDEARAAGLMHPNCRHTVRAYLPGVSLLIKQGRTADPKGAAARDRLRALERTVRAWREREVAALDPAARAHAAAKVAQWTAEISRHVAETKVPRVRYREQIGAGIIPTRGVVDHTATALGIPTQPAFDL